MNRCLAIGLAGWVIVMTPCLSAGDTAEFRGAWVSRFEWASSDADKCRENIVEIFSALEDANFNAAVFQIRGAAETLYPSDLEPWSPLLGGGDPGFDPVAMAIEEARKRGIAFHAYINPLPLRSVRWPDAPQEPDHLYYRHGPNAPQSWVCVDSEGRPARSDYYYLSAGIPAVQAYVRTVIMDVIRRYDVDGIHLDRIRYPGPEYSHDSISRRRFLGRGNPNLLEWPDWQREQLNKFVNDLAAEIRSEKPDVIVSCAAWGIYNRYHIDGYGGFSSGYHDYFQDTWTWRRLGAMDLLMPMIYWDLPEPKPNYDELMADFVQGVGADSFVGGQRVFSPEENARQIQLTREADAHGTLLWNFRSAQRRGLLDHLRDGLYVKKAATPIVDRLKKQRSGVVLGTILADDGKPLVDAHVTIHPAGEGRRRGRRRPRTWTSSDDGRFAFLNVLPGPVKLVVNYEGAPRVTSNTIQVRTNEVSSIQITVEGAAEARDKPFLTILRPEDDSTTDREAIHVLGRTEPGYRVTVAGDEVEVYATGGFAKDNIPLDLGDNEIKIALENRRLSYSRVLAVTRVAPESIPAATTLRIIQPTNDLALQPGQILEIRAEGPPKRTGHVSLFNGKVKLPLAEEIDGDARTKGIYTAVMRVPESLIAKQSRIEVTLDRTGKKAALRSIAAGNLEVWDPAQVRIAEVSEAETGITYGLHSVRLGGPWIARVTGGTRLEVTSKQEGKYRVRLSSSMTGWVPERNVEMLPAGTAVPHNYFTYCSVMGDEDHETLSIGLRAPVAFAVRPEIEPSNRLYIDLFNTHDAMTWISHRSTAEVIGTVRAEQIEENWLRLTVPLECKQIWGYWTKIVDGNFTLHVRRPPSLANYPDSPLRDLTVALEAGHGGPGSGAVGNFGTKEKTINLQASAALQHELEVRGATVTQVRPGDDSPDLGERVTRTNDSGADLFVSLHANAAGASQGFLRVSGTSTYYHGIHCRLPAELIYKKMLGLGWNEFGVVGNFSYKPLLNTRLPAILVEQAFMSHPGDEARLLDPTYQRQQAIAIADGLEAFLERVRE